ncbi:MAG: response regulator [Acidobacteriaceae bacterium]
MSEQNVADTSSYQAAEEYNGGDYGNSDFDSSESGDANDGGQPGPGMGQSKSSRRRRRKRKNKMGGDGPTVAGGEGDSGSPIVPMVMEGESLALAASASAPPQTRKQQGGSQQGSQQQGNGQQQGQGGKRWKKKFRDRERRPGGGGGGGRSENPGNDFRADAGSSNGNGYGGGNGGGYRPDNFGNQIGGFKRKGKGGNGGQARERGFVGPMDHSYRASGEFGDAPPSTIQVAGHGRRGGHRHTGDSQPIDRSMPRPIPIPEGAQTHIYFFIEELFFQAKIQETAKKLGVKVSFVKNDKDAVAALTEGEENKPALIVFDLNNANAKPLTLIPKLKTKLKRSASIIGFLSHLQGDLKAKAVEAGCDVVMPRAAFSQNLPNLLRRYGVEEEEEVNFNC